MLLLQHPPGFQSACFLLLFLLQEGGDGVRNAGLRGALDPARVGPEVESLEVIIPNGKRLFLVVATIVGREHDEYRIEGKRPGTAVF